MQFRDGPVVNHTQVQRNKEEDRSFMNLGGAVVNKKSIRGNKVRSIVSSLAVMAVSH